MAGCFVIVTNVPMDGEDGCNARSTLKANKDQHGIERNLGFIKGPLIVNSLFLKKPERIEVMGLILVQKGGRKVYEKDTHLTTLSGENLSLIFRRNDLWEK